MKRVHDEQSEKGESTEWMISEHIASKCMHKKGVSWYNAWGVECMINRVHQEESAWG